jgi:RNA polymerase sigma-70 factor, ECF subfamily
MDETLSALEDLYRRKYEHFRKMLASITGSYETGHDATQEAFARAIAQRRSFRGESSLETWVWRIATRTAIDARRRGARASPGRWIALGFVEPERDPELAAAVQALPPRQRLMVFLRFFADLSYSDIAELCDVSEGTVAASLSHARAESS